MLPLSDFVVKLQNAVTHSLTNQSAGIAGKTQTCLLQAGFREVKKSICNFLTDLQKNLKNNLLLQLICNFKRLNKRTILCFNC